MRKMILCEAGATKADWRLIEDGVQVRQFFTRGTNVSTMKMEVIASIMEEAAGKLAVFGWNKNPL